MNRTELQKKLNGREYRNEITKEECELAKENGLVIIFGASDDLMEFRGAIYDEIDIRDEDTVYIYKGETLHPEEPFESIEDQISFLQKFGINDLTTKFITCKWDYQDYSWFFETGLPCLGFDIMEDGEKYCRGLILDINTVK